MINKKGDEVVPLSTEDEFEAAGDAFMKINPLVKQILLPAIEKAVRRTAEKEKCDEVPRPTGRVGELEGRDVIWYVGTCWGALPSDDAGNSTHYGMGGC
jgi:hypothetical protein